jgi:uncharacterized protein DUF6529
LSRLGCAFFGAFTVKMLILPKRGLPAGHSPWRGVVFIVLTGVWFTSAYWFFSTYGISPVSIAIQGGAADAGTMRVCRGQPTNGGYRSSPQARAAYAARACG